MRRVKTALDSCPVVRRATKRAAARVVRQLVKEFGLAFHPDTPAKDYVDAKGKRLLRGNRAKGYDCKVNFAFRLLGKKVYDIGLKEQKKLLKRRK